MGITIREAGAQDAPAIVQLIGELAGGDDRSPVTEAYVETYLASIRSRILLAELEGCVVGLLSYSVRPDLYHAADACLIEELVVHQGVRRQGVGGALLTEVLARLAALGCAEVSVAALPDNTKAIRLYRAHGLTEEAVFLEKHFGT
jgi:ribosomal protein S18 acetylase RimI-like enzyme